MPIHPSSPWDTPDFRRLFTAAAASDLGTQIGYAAMPLVAVVALDAGPGEVGLLATLSTVAFLLVGLPAGARVDRVRRRRTMIAADLVRAVLLASVPVAWALGLLTLPQLYLVALLTGCATVFFDVSAQSHLPDLVGRDALLPANAGLASLQAAGNVAGRSLGGLLCQVLTAPLALAWHAASYLVSAAFLRRIRSPDAPPVRSGPAERLRTQVGQGLRHVFHTAELRALAVSGACANLGFQLVNTMLPVLLVDELRLPQVALGLFWSVGGVGVLLGSRLARPLAGRFGVGGTLGTVGLLTGPVALLVPLLDRGPWLWLAGLGWLLTCGQAGVNNVLGVSLRQQLTPDALLGRMNATFRFLLTGALAVGSAVAAVVGQFVGVRPVLWLGGLCLALTWLPVVRSPLRGLVGFPPAPGRERDGAGPSSRSTGERAEAATSRDGK